MIDPMILSAESPSRRAVSESSPPEHRASTCQVIELRPRLTPRQEAHLRNWLSAGRRMGLLDAEITRAPNADLPRPGPCVLIWVREAPDPAYLVAMQDRRWVVRDGIRRRQLGEFAAFEQALDFIRPVLKLPEGP